MGGNMKRKDSYLVLAFVLTVLLATPFSTANIVIESMDQNCELRSLYLNGGWLEKINGINIVHLNGSFYEMGYQYGFLLKEEITENLRAANCYYLNEFKLTFDDFLEIWNIQRNYVSQDIINYTQGIADGADLPFDNVAISWVYEGGVYLRYKCSGFSVWGEATYDNELYFCRSFDWYVDIQDPVTGKYIQENPVLIIANPENGNAFLYPSFAGFTPEGGINEKNVAVSNLWSPNSDTTRNGKSMNVRLFEALNKASNAEEAVDIITSYRTFGYNFLVADGETPIGYAIETTANQTYVGTWDNPVESDRPFWKIKHAVRRSNFFLNPKLSSFQRNPHNPRSIRHAFGILGGDKGWFFTWLHYKAVGRGIEQFWGDINLNITMEIIRGVYNLKYDIVWRFLNKFWNYPLRTCWQWVACPKTGDFLVSFADVGIMAFKCSVQFFNFFELLEEEPP